MTNLVIVHIHNCNFSLGYFVATVVVVVVVELVSLGGISTDTGCGGCIMDAMGGNIINLM